MARFRTQLRPGFSGEKGAVMGISFNAAGLLNGNGIDVSSIVQELLSQQTATITALQNQQTDLSTNTGLLQGFNNNLTNLASAVLDLANPLGPLTAQAATSSDSSVLTATAQTNATAGSHQIVVSNLATTATVYTNPIQDANTSFLPSGATSADIKLQIGGGSGTTHDIAITQGNNDTLTSLAAYINNQKWGVTANVVTDANGARLALYGQATGTPGALAITTNTSILAFNPATGGTNASLTIDGVPYSSATNSITGAIPNVTLNLQSGDPQTTVQLTVGPDTTQATSAINSFISAYNTLIGNLNSQFTLDPTSNTEGPLAGDTFLRTLQSRMLDDVSYAITGNSGLVNLASIGIDMNNDGTLTVNQTATDTHPSLANVLATNPAAVQNFFQNATGDGFAQNFNNDLANLSDPTEGILNVDITGSQNEQTELTNQINDLQDRLSAQQATLTLQFDQVNATLEAYPALLLEVTSEIGALNGNYNVSNTTPNTTPNVGTSTTSSTGS
jgi:flagellar hook-associated protein 2